MSKKAESRFNCKLNGQHDQKAHDKTEEDVCYFVFKSVSGKSINGGKKIIAECEG